MQISTFRAPVLILEHDLITREILSAHLRQAGIEIVEATAAAMALALAARQAFDLVVLDGNLPDGSGFDVAMRLRRDHDMPIIFLTARGAGEDRQEDFQRGGEDYLVKPVDPPELLARIRVSLRCRLKLPVADPPPLAGPALATPVVEGKQVVGSASSTPDLLRQELADAGGVPAQFTRAQFDPFAAFFGRGILPVHCGHLMEVVAPAAAMKSRIIHVMASHGPLGAERATILPPCEPAP